MTKRIRIELDDLSGNRAGTILYVDEPPALTAVQLDAVRSAVTGLLELLQEVIDAHDWSDRPTGWPVPDAKDLAVVLLAERLADAQAYQREAARRGVLAL